jgi:DNA-binding NtrC family response regulator
LDNSLINDSSHRFDSPRRVLVVDDPAGARKRVVDRLVAAGFEIAYAKDGLDAIEMFECHPVDLVVTDWRMPRLNGLGLVRRLREVSDVPVVMITAFGSIPDCEQAIRVGADRYLEFERDLDRVGEIACELVQCRIARGPVWIRDGMQAGPRERGLNAHQPGAEADPLGRHVIWITASEARSLARREFRDELQRHCFECRGNVSEMARRMGKDRSTIRYHLRRFDMLESKSAEPGPGRSQHQRNCSPD